MQLLKYEFEMNLSPFKLQEVETCTNPNDYPNDPNAILNRPRKIVPRSLELKVAVSKGIRVTLKKLCVTRDADKNSIYAKEVVSMYIL